LTFDDEGEAKEDEKKRSDNSIFFGTAGFRRETGASQLELRSLMQERPELFGVILFFPSSKESCASRRRISLSTHT
jgi:hypothetical protein